MSAKSGHLEIKVWGKTNSYREFLLDFEFCLVLYGQKNPEVSSLQNVCQLKKIFLANSTLFLKIITCTLGTKMPELMIQALDLHEWDLDFKIIKFSFLCSSIPASPAYGVYIYIMYNVWFDFKSS